MKESRLNKNLEKLETIMEVDAPPFLFTHIHQKIQSHYVNYITPKLKWSLALCLAILVALNVLVGINQSSSLAESNVAQSFKLLPDNNLYK